MGQMMVNGQTRASLSHDEIERLIRVAVCVCIAIAYRVHIEPKF